MRKFGWITAICTGLSLGMATPAMAYLDPGTGSMVLQLILGGVAGGLVIIKLYWARLKEVFVRKERGDEVDDQ